MNLTPPEHPKRSGRQPGTPKTGGRVKGTPNKSTAAVKEALTSAFEGLAGVPALIEWGRENPTEFYRLWSRLLPLQAKIEATLSLDDTLADRLARAKARAIGGE